MATYLYAFGIAAQSTRIEVLRFSFAEATIGAGAKYRGYEKKIRNINKNLYAIFWVEDPKIPGFHESEQNRLLEMQAINFHRF